MAETKPLASLSPSLLARKGSARPAMRPQGYINFATQRDSHDEDLGWNDLGHEEPSAEVISMSNYVADVPQVAAEPAVVKQQQDLAQKIVPSVAPAQPFGLQRAAPGARGKAAFTLRLDPERHLKLRLFSALSHRSAQQIVTAALDAVLATQSEAISKAANGSSEG